MALFGRKKNSPEPDAEPIAQASAVEEQQLTRRTPAEHLASVLDGVRPMRPFGMGVNDVSGLTLCEDISSDIDVPMVTTARVEGYGVRAANIVGATPRRPIDLRLVGLVDRRDTLPSEAVAPGACVLVAEGAPVPKGVDAVVPLGDAEQSGRIVSFPVEARLRQNLRMRGSDLADGERLLPAGTILDARAIALLAEVGLDKVLVRPRPRVVVFSVGPGLVAPGMPITSLNQRYASGTALIAAAARTDGATVYPLEIVGRDAAALKRTITDQAIRADAIVVLTQGEPDAILVAEVLEAAGTVEFAHVTMNAGSAQASGRIGEEQVPVLVFPADAVTAFACYHVYVRPLLDRLAARETVAEPCRASVTEGVRAAMSGKRYLPAFADDAGIRPLSSAGSELAYDLVKANALLIVPQGEELAVGAEAEYVCLDVPPSA